MHATDVQGRGGACVERVGGWVPPGVARQAQRSGHSLSARFAQKQNWRECFDIGLSSLRRAAWGALAVQMCGAALCWHVVDRCMHVATRGWMHGWV